MALKTDGKPDWGVPEESSAAILKRGIHMDITGLEGGGKSSLALTVALCGPTGYADIDQSFDRAHRPEGKAGKKAFAGVKALPVRYIATPSQEETKKICSEAWLNLANRVDLAVKSWAKAIVIDTASEDWELIRLGSFGTLTPRGRTDALYGPVNARFRMHLRGVNRHNRRHLVTITQLKDEYKDIVDNGRKESVKTGKHTPVGFKEMGYLCDIRIRVHRKKDDFKGVIELCKLPPNGPSLEGEELEGDQLDFSYIVALATGTEREDWLAK